MEIKYWNCNTEPRAGIKVIMQSLGHYLQRKILRGIKEKKSSLLSGMGTLSVFCKRKKLRKKNKE